MAANCGVRHCLTLNDVTSHFYPPNLLQWHIKKVLKEKKIPEEYLHLIFSIHTSLDPAGSFKQAQSRLETIFDQLLTLHLVHVPLSRRLARKRHK
ncbi:hypothetical protein PGT21_028591 [Puccinia graminis f. sp. tritici]|uniref:Uncharacterized protein n=1 Tax=Puccinia graminis f. sp. tritici TaxID=56615 RepID=A0A5B0PYV5_PUCGR|nr:hypothetical protein PGT21_028591 [Puccinia graminis f. sp. tritici]